MRFAMLLLACFASGWRHIPNNAELMTHGEEKSMDENMRAHTHTSSSDDVSSSLILTKSSSLTKSNIVINAINADKTELGGRDFATKGEETVRSLKQKIWIQAGVDLENFALTLRGEELEPGTQLTPDMIDSGLTAVLETTPSKILIKDGDAELNIDTEDHDTVGILKTKIAKALFQHQSRCDPALIHLTDQGLADDTALTPEMKWSGLTMKPVKNIHIAIYQPRLWGDTTALNLDNKNAFSIVVTTADTVETLRAKILEPGQYTWLAKYSGYHADQDPTVFSLHVTNSRGRASGDLTDESLQQLLTNEFPFPRLILLKAPDSYKKALYPNYG